MISGNGLNEYIKIDAEACNVTINEVSDFVKAINFPFNKFLLSGKPEHMAEVEKIMAKEFGDRLNVFRSDPFYVELLPRYVDKGVAVEKLVKHLDIQREKVICIGDSYNDLPMLRLQEWALQWAMHSRRLRKWQIMLQHQMMKTEL